MTSVARSVDTSISKTNNGETSQAAASDLWDLIHAPGANRFAQAQRNRTLTHPSLRQPTVREENDHRAHSKCKKIHVPVCTECTTESCTGTVPTKSPTSNTGDGSNAGPSLAEVTPEEALMSRLKNVLERLERLGYSSSQHQTQSIEYESSPTSTLHFPDSRIVPSKSASNHIQAFKIEHESSPTSTLHFPNPTCEERPPKPSATKMQGVDAVPVSATSELQMKKPSHSFVICADSQIGMTSQNREWQTELQYCRQAIRKINAIHPRPDFVCVCGDLVDMEYTFFANEKTGLTKEECDAIQDQQNVDFKETWSTLDDRIPLVCLCGNHDIGNRPTRMSIDKFTSAFGDDYLAFWTNGSYNIVLNNVLFTDPTGAPDVFHEQLKWLEDRLQYASDLNANHIFVFGHHPWFLYNEDEDAETMFGGCAFPDEWGASDKVFPDWYFSVPKKYRHIALSLFKKYGVSASFSGHFHQNLVSKSSFGMDMIITGPLSEVLESSGKPKEQLDLEDDGRGLRIVEVERDCFTHRFELI